MLDKLIAFEELEEQMTVLLEGQDVPPVEWHMYIITQLGKEGWSHWRTIKDKVNKDVQKEVVTEFRKGMEISDSYWTAR